MRDKFETRRFKIKLSLYKMTTKPSYQCGFSLDLATRQINLTCQRVGVTSTQRLTSSDSHLPVIVMPTTTSVLAGSAPPAPVYPPTAPVEVSVSRLGDLLNTLAIMNPAAPGLAITCVPITGTTATVSLGNLQTMLT